MILYSYIIIFSLVLYNTNISGDRADDVMRQRRRDGLAIPPVFGPLASFTRVEDGEKMISSSGPASTSQSLFFKMETKIGNSDAAKTRSLRRRPFINYGLDNDDLEEACNLDKIDQNAYVPRENAVGNQAVALRITGTNAMFYKVRILSAQDTILDQQGDHYFLECYIEGMVDFICGQARSLYKDCVLQSTAKKSGAIAAQKRMVADEKTGFSFVNYTIHGTEGNNLLGRAWGNYSTIVFSYCHFDHFDHTIECDTAAFSRKHGVMEGS